MAPLMPWLHVK